MWHSWLVGVLFHKSEGHKFDSCSWHLPELRAPSWGHAPIDVSVTPWRFSLFLPLFSSL